MSMAISYHIKAKNLALFFLIMKLKLLLHGVTSTNHINGKFHQINYGKFYLRNPSDSYYLFPGSEGSFLFITKNSTNVQTKSNIDPTEFATKIYQTYYES